MVGQRAIKDRFVGERVPDPLLKLFAGDCILRLAAHRTIVNSRSQRTTQGQRHTFHAGSPSPTEKKMISARPTMLSIGTEPTRLRTRASRALAPLSDQH